MSNFSYFFFFLWEYFVLKFFGTFLIRESILCFRRLSFMHNLAAHSLNSSCLLTSHEVLAISCEKHGNYTLSVWLMDFRQIFPWCHVLSLFLLSLCGVPFVVECWVVSHRAFTCRQEPFHVTACPSGPWITLTADWHLFPSLSPEITAVQDAAFSF